MGWTSPEAKELFQQFVKYDAERRRRELLRVSEALQLVPVGQETLKDLCALSPDDAECALRQHPGYALDRKIESVRTMLDLFRRALADLSRAVADFPELSGPDGRVARERLEQEIAVLVNKELFAALGAAKTLVDYSRRIKDIVSADSFEAKRKEAFSLNEHALIVDLRNLALHQVHFTANWRKVYQGGKSSTHFVIKHEDLLADGELSERAREHLNQLGPTCDVTDLLEGYSKRVESFYGWLLPEVELQLPIAVKDCRACRKAVRIHHGRLSHRFLIGMWMQAGADPYQHLQKHLTSEQLKMMETFQPRSAEQVDYIVSCLDRDGICDEDLRKIVYEFFKVRS